MRHTVLALLLLSRAALAGAEPWHESYEKALAAAKKDGRIVMVLLAAPSRDAQGRDLCKTFREKTLTDKRVAALVKARTAPVVYDLAQLVRKRQKLPQAVRSALGSDLPSTVPVTIFLDGKGKKLAVVDGYATADAFLPQLEAVTAPAKGQERVERGGKSADDYDDLRVAMDALDSALGGMAGAAEKGDPATRLYDAGQTFERLKKKAHAIRAYTECVKKYPKSPVSAKCRKRLAALRR